MRFEVLGRLHVVVGAGTGARSSIGSAPSLGGPKQRFVLAHLLAEPNRVVSLDRLIDGLWGDDPPETARHTVQGYVSELRKSVGALIEREGGGYLIRATADTLDSLEFEARVAAARAHLPREPLDAAAELERALELWRGRAFDEFPESALQAERVRLEELRLAAFEELVQARLAAGQHGDLIGALERESQEHPYREELHALRMIALYRSGRQADALRVFQAIRAVLADDLGIMPSPRLRRLEEQILLQDPDLDPPPGPSVAPAHGDRWLDNPFLGLRAFREVDHSRFFGQEQLIERLATRVVGSDRFTALVGPSGSGKSSVVQAGLIPRLRLDHPDLVVASMQPGYQPFAMLDAALGDLPGGRTPTGTVPVRSLELLEAHLHGVSRLLLVVDQFEELFTMVDATDSARFLAVLADVAAEPSDRVHVLVTLRADFYDRPLVDPRMGHLFAENVVSMAALGPDQLEAAATLPARQLDIAVEPRLVGRLIADVAGQPNALPLFQYALTELFDARDGAVLDLATYERIGGVRQAVARRAESLYGQLDPTEQETARQLFLRIATVSGDIVGRRRVPASELVSLDVDVVALRSVIDLFARYRLLALDRDPATGGPTIEVAHEALLTEWRRLRDWIDQHRGDLSKQASFVAAVNEWEASGRDPGYLLTGTRLDDYQRWADSTGLRLTVTEHDFIASAVAARAAQVAAVAQRERSQLALRRRSRVLWFALFVVVAVLAGAVAYPLFSGGGRHDAVAVVLGGRRADSAFEELVARGVEDVVAESDLDAVVLEPPYTDLDAQLRQVAEDGPSIIVGSFMMHEPLLEVAADYPNVRFALIDDNQEHSQTPNVVSVRFAHEQGSFLVGAAAAMQSSTGRVGYIGANSQPFIESFRAGFEQGVAAVEPAIEVRSELVFPATASGANDGGYQHPDRAKAIATAMYGDGVDVIFVAAGESGLGVIDAALELSRPDRTLWVIGVDTDQYYDIDDARRAHLLTSMFKRIDLGVSALVEARFDGTLGDADVITVGLDDGAVGYTETGAHLTAETRASLGRLRTAILDGSITVDPVPATPPPTVTTTDFLYELETRERIPFPDGMSAGLTSADGAYVATETCCERGDTLTIASRDGRDVSTLSTPPGLSAYLASWSPNGHVLVYQLRDGGTDDFGSLVTHDLDTGAVTRLVEFDRRGAWWLTAPKFSLDGRSVTYHASRTDRGPNEFDAWSVPVSGGAPTMVLADASFPTRLANGDLVFVRPGDDGPGGTEIYLASPTGDLRRLVTTRSEIWFPQVSPDSTRIAYSDGGLVYVLDIADSGPAEFVTFGTDVGWLDADTLVVKDA